MSRELLLFVKSIWYGAMLVLIYDILRIGRGVIRHSAAVMAVEDLCFWIFCALFLFSRCFTENSGVLRAYLGAGVILGSLACHLSVSAVFVKFFIFLLKKVLKVLVFPLNLVKKRIKRLKSHLIRVKLVLNKKLAKRKRGKRPPETNKGELNEEKKKRRQKKRGKGKEPSE